MPNNFNTPAGQTIARELMIAYLNTGTESAPVWSPFGKRTSDSSIDYDWGEDTSKDILGNTWTTMKKPTMTQSFDPGTWTAATRPSRRFTSWPSSSRTPRR